MGDAGFFKGTSSEQDTRFKDKEKSLLKSINFPKELDHKVDMRKVELSVMRPWITEKIMELLGFEDEVVVEYVNGLLDDSTSPVVDPKRMQINLTGFLESKTGPFMSELWTLLLSAQQSPLKIPALFIEQKKEEMRKREQADQQAQALIKQRQEEEEKREYRLAEIRSRERGQQATTRDRVQVPEPTQRNRSRPEVTNGYSRSNFVPPRDRDSGWGNRGGTRLADDSTREPPSNGKREMSHSPIRPRRDSHSQRENQSSYSRRPRSSMRSRSRSPPSSRRSYRRASPSPRPHKRHADSTKSRRRGSPYRVNERARLQKSTEGRSSSSDSAPRPARRHRSITRSISPPRHARRPRSSSRSISPPRHSRRRRSVTRSISPPLRRVSDLSIANGGHDDKSSRRDQSSAKTSGWRRSRSPPPRKRAREDNDKVQREREKEKDSRKIRDRKASSRSPSPYDRSSIRHSARKTEKDGFQKDSARPGVVEHEPPRSNPAHSPPATLSSIRSSSGGSKEPVIKNNREDRTIKKHPPVISIKGRASKTTDESSHDDQRLHYPTELLVEDQNDDCSTVLASATNIIPDQTRSQKLTEVVKERLLREKVKASMINSHK